MADAVVIHSPEAAAEIVCHEEQMVIWASDFVGMLSLGGYLRDNLDYAEGVNLTEDVKRELRSVIESAFGHPEAKTIIRRRG
jgi:hypothetical protein